MLLTNMVPFCNTKNNNLFIHICLQLFMIVQSDKLIADIILWVGQKLKLLVLDY